MKQAAMIKLTSKASYKEEEEKEKLKSEFEADDGNCDSDDDIDDGDESAPASSRKRSKNQKNSGNSNKRRKTEASTIQSARKSILKTDTKQEAASATTTTAGPLLMSKKIRTSDSKSNYLETIPDDYVPTTERFTERGGYAHTTNSRLAISRANKGNTPWNKGKIRSGSDRAKIAAGVKARNRANLMEKLKKINLTEDEWFSVKRQIKLARERLRRAKVANENKEVEKQKLAKIGLEKANADVRRNIARVRKERKKIEKETKEILDKLAIDSAKDEEDAIQQAADDEESENDIEIDSEEEASDWSSNDKKEGNSSSEDDDDLYGDSILSHSIFARYYRWRDHPFDSNETSYAKSCPIGGPGGLTCCEFCTAQFSQYMTATFKDMEEQKITNIGAETSQLLDFLGTAKTRLETAVRAARKKAPPHPPDLSSKVPPARVVT